MRRNSFLCTVLTTDEALEALYRGAQINNWILTDRQEVELYGKSRNMFSTYPLEKDEGSDRLLLDNKPMSDDAIQNFHTILQNEWFMPDSYKKINMERYLLGKCETQEEQDRVKYEMKLYKKKDLEDVLRYLVYFMDVAKKQKLVLGVGRGSSVASYCLYLLGIHRIDSLKFNLDIHEFLK